MSRETLEMPTPAEAAATEPEPTKDLFTPRDLAQMESLGIPPAEAVRQIELFRDPPPYTRVLRPSTPGDGIRVLSEEEQPKLLERFHDAVHRGLVGKLVPASGAASRMFKGLLAWLGEDGAAPSDDVREFFESLPRFAFFERLREVMERDGQELDAHPAPERWRTVLSYLLEPRGLGYNDLPKGQLLFHRYPDGPRTPFEEHLVEAAATARDGNRTCRLHLTVAPEHEERFAELLRDARQRFEGPLDARFEVGFSHQSHATDTIAVDLNDRPFRLEDGSLLFRPGGHGSLIENLAELGRQGWDVVLLKNIDNVVPDGRKPPVNRWKQLLAGLLVDLRARVFDLAERLERMDAADPAAAGLLAEAERFCAERLSRPLSRGGHETGTDGFEARRRRLLEALERPLRVCGVVRNTGEPGGGPFWVESADGEVSLQIVETSQIDPDSPEQQAALRASTHFNPVDIACALRDRHGRPYDLHRFIDPSTVFIARKSHEGRPLKALERPGLWNGAMAGWNTVFVEVPVKTFAPVKTVLDLLRPEHQG
jgi:hypothetical protein